MAQEPTDYRKLYEEERTRRLALEHANKELEVAQERLNHVIAEQAKKIHSSKVRLDRVRAEIDEELEIAKSVQAGLLPRELPEFVNLKTADVYIPTGKVGGDMYDVVLTPTQKVAVLIFDVSGHGVPAALIAAMAKMLFAHYIEKIESPSVIFTEVNKRLCAFINTDHYLTAFLGVLDPIKNTMTYSCAGHVRPIVYRAAEARAESMGGRGFFLGHSALLDVAQYHEESIDFAPGDKVLFYTDGLTEGANAENELYGSQRLLDTMQKNGQLPLKDLLDVILQDQIEFRNGTELRDDFSMLCIETGSSEWLLRESGFIKEDGPRVLMVCTYRDIDPVCSAILRTLDDNGYSDIDIKRAKICIFEMLMNAIEHGNRSDPRKKVIVLYTVTPESLRISVLDEGDGFDYRSLPDPLAEENRLKDHGRGIFIIREYMDRVVFNEKGNRILVEKCHSRSRGHGN